MLKKKILFQGSFVPCYEHSEKDILKFIEENPDANGIDIRDSVAPELPMSTFYDTLSRLQITYKKRA